VNEIQIIFDARQRPGEYAAGNGAYPKAPERCPHKRCKARVRQKKHGFYKRNLITFGFVGVIAVRRYICPVCEKTVSMLPSFCIPKFQYAAAFIVFVLASTFKGMSSKRIERRLRSRFPGAERRQVLFYKQRFKGNRALIQYGANNMSPEYIPLGGIPGNEAWARRFLCEMRRRTSANGFNAEFHNKIEKSFMSRSKSIA
jgi:hypothetical protein